MSRIRSIHPGFFTDEDLVQVSIEARLLFLGLGVEADDKGIFEWKLTTIKMRLFPADNVDIDTLLAELVSIDAVSGYEIDGRKYGAIRNFRKFQRPKKPNDIHPMPPEFGTYVGIGGAGSEPVPHQFPTSSEITPQMEDGGGRRDKKLSQGGESLVGHSRGGRV
ncbi:hypothetical protein [Paradevosia shaoguanensis]|uniref:Uncharacterized protein n=1 Tax=Paradevosia shaoguanensis TaxID=1335043 RepID=A0AA41QRH7_9HYPH|nr:hypothetical protein [Paradevosia shaoguanensis]MCF1744750.1 hypothetical protein [Paradevosia shaoguanensis]MCI0129233.1 hypothetical protein [Paradevosia shaoguanensis]